MIHLLKNPLSRLQKSILLITLSLAFVAAYVYVPYRLPTNGGIRFGWSWSPVEYSDSLTKKILSGLDLDQLEKEVSMDMSSVRRSHMRQARRAPSHALCIAGAIAIIGLGSILLLDNIRSNRAPPRHLERRTNWREIGRIGFVSFALFALTLAPYERDEHSWARSGTGHRIQMGLPFRWLCYTHLEIGRSAPPYNTLSQGEKYGCGVYQIDWADLGLDIGFVAAAGLLICAAWKRLVAGKVPHGIGLRLMGLCVAAVVTGAGMVVLDSLVEDAVVKLGLLAIPLLLNATTLFAASSYLTMCVGAAVSVVGLWYGVCLTALFADSVPIHGPALHAEELAVIGFLFVAFVALLLPVVVVSRMTKAGHRRSFFASSGLAE